METRNKLDAGRARVRALAEASGLDGEAVLRALETRFGPTFLAYVTSDEMGAAALAMAGDLDPRFIPSTDETTTNEEGDPHE